MTCDMTEYRCHMEQYFKFGPLPPASLVIVAVSGEAQSLNYCTNFLCGTRILIDGVYQNT